MQDCQDSDFDYATLDDSDPTHLKNVIQKLLRKTNVLISSLDTLTSRFDFTQKQAIFWKNQYFSLKESCQKYVDAEGMQPFHYLQNLQQQLKKEKNQKLFLSEKYAHQGARKPRKIIRIGQPQNVQKFDSIQTYPSKQYNPQTTVKKQRMQKSISNMMINNQSHSDQKKKAKSKQSVGPKKRIVFKFSHK